MRALHKHGQAVWLDYIRRALLEAGDLDRLIKEDGLAGVTTNPTIFEKAVSGSDDYDEQLRQILRNDPHVEARRLYEELVVEDVRMALDALLPVYERSKKTDGYVSLELSPELAHDSEGSVKEAGHFWQVVGRPNLMIKVPATKAGITTIEELVAREINVNVTLVFSLPNYEAVARAYIAGLEKCGHPENVASVASFFISRVDTLFDDLLEKEGSPEARALGGKVAVSNAKVAYARFKEIFRGSEWQNLKKKGARVQRPLWASTSTKNPSYPDVLYVEQLIGRHTVNTMPPATMQAFRDHGVVENTLHKDLEGAKSRLESLAALGIDFEVQAQRLQDEGVRLFQESYDKLLATLDEKRGTLIHGRRQHQTFDLGAYQYHVDSRITSWENSEFNKRLWAKDYRLWSSTPVPEIEDRLGWLALPELMHEKIDGILEFAKGIKQEGFTHVVLLGMGGSSLAPEVYQNTFGNASGFPELVVLDSTHPEAVRTVEKRVRLKKSLFIVASKSGTTLEPQALFKYFWGQLEASVKDPGRHFVAITDPGTALQELAEERGFQKVFLATPDLGGRYAALTVFGLVPAALVGSDVHLLLDRAWTAVESCAACVGEKKIPGLTLGAALGELGIRGRDKVTFLTEPEVSAFPNWLEQLIAESTGKDGKGLIPVVGEPLTHFEVYGDDRVFIYFSFGRNRLSPAKEMVDLVRTRAHPLIEINLSDAYDLGREILKWEVAVAAAGSIMGIHPFNQPDVEVAKELARQAMSGEEVATQSETETFPMSDTMGVARGVRRWLGSATKGDYVAIQAYLPSNKKIGTGLHRIRQTILQRSGLATTLGYGPRFLHSTGQLHKGGANKGLFLQVVHEASEDLAVPGEEYSFGDIIRSQALGDYRALTGAGRRILRIKLEKDIDQELIILAAIMGA